MKGRAYMGYVRFKIGNYIAILESEYKIIEVEAASLTQAYYKAQKYFDEKYGTNTHIVVLPVPSRIGVLN